MLVHHGPAVLFAQSRHVENRRRDAPVDIPENVLLAFETTHEHSRFDANRRFQVQTVDDSGDVQIVSLGELPRSQFVVTIVRGSMMFSAQRDCR